MKKGRVPLNFSSPMPDVLPCIIDRVRGKKPLWVNPDCGLKTRHWEEAYPALENMIAAAVQVRAS